MYGRPMVNSFGKFYMYVNTDIRSTAMAMSPSDTPTPVLVAEDPDGPYYGWIRADLDEPIMIQPREAMFRMQFPYGFESEEERGHGVHLRLTVQPRTE